MIENDKELDLGEAYQAYFNTIRRYVVSRLRCDTATAEEACSDVFYLLQTKWDELLSHKPPVILTWLYRTANFVILDYQKQLVKRRAEQELESVLQEESSTWDEIQSVGAQYDYDLLLRSIERTLKSREWALFRALYIDKQPPAQIAARLDISPAAVYLRKARLDRKLRAILNDYKKL